MVHSWPGGCTYHPGVCSSSQGQCLARVLLSPPPNYPPPATHVYKCFIFSSSTHVYKRFIFSSTTHVYKCFIFPSPTHVYKCFILPSPTHVYKCVISPPPSTSPFYFPPPTSTRALYVPTFTSSSALYPSPTSTRGLYLPYPFIHVFYIPTHPPRHKCFISPDTSTRALYSPSRQ